MTAGRPDVPSTPRVMVAGEHALLAEYPDLAAALRARDDLERHPAVGVTEIVSGARTLLLRFDAMLTTAERLEALLATRRPSGPAATTESRARDPVEIPVHYDGEDLAATARLLRMDVAELIDWHTGCLWTSAFGGFAPGFSYLVPDRAPLNVPRRPSPRVSVPAGAVALAGEFSAVYPRRSPGGWQLIGGTELPMWDLGRPSPATVPVGGTVRFVAIEQR